MTGKRSGLAAVIFIGMLCLGGVAGHARTLSVHIEPASAAIEEITIEKTGEAPFEIVKKSEGLYEAEEPVPPDISVPQYYIVVGRWKANGELISTQFYMKAPATVDPQVWIFAERPPATLAYLNSLEGGGENFDLLIKRYQLARDIYRRSRLLDNDVPRRALNAWFAAALALAQGFSFFGPDREAAKFASENGSPSIRALAPQLAVLDWQDAALIQSAYKSGRYEEAEALNTHFLDQFTALAAPEKSAVTKYYGINASLLQSNAVAISAKLTTINQKGTLNEKSLVD